MFGGNWDAMKILLICHEGAELDQELLARWLSSFSDLVGIVLVHEPPKRLWRRGRRETKRVGILRFLDVLAFRMYYRLLLARKDASWERQRLEEDCRRYPEV